MAEKKYPIRTLLVGIDLSDMDKVVMQYAKRVCGWFPVERVTFIHVVKSMELPGETVEKYHDVLAPVDEGIVHQVQRSLDEHFGKPEGVKVAVEVLEGSPIDQILRYIKLKKVDLMLVGQKETTGGSGILTGGIARKSPSHVLLVPEHLKSQEVKKVVVALDFSKNSKTALEYSVEVGKKSSAEIVCVHAYQVPMGYSKSGKSYEEFAAIIEGHAQEEFKRFTSGLNTELSCVFTLAEKGHLPAALVASMDAQNPDIVFMGSKGRTNAASVLLGSVAEKIAFWRAQIPTFIVKGEQKNLGFFEAFMRI
jgi:nucleotide-binding universal stress UspA family protein